MRIKHCIPQFPLAELTRKRRSTWTGNLNALTPDKLWFAYLSFGAVYVSHHVLKEYLDRYRGEFDHAYDRLREITFAWQKELGVIPNDAALTP